MQIPLAGKVLKPLMIRSFSGSLFVIEQTFEVATSKNVPSLTDAFERQDLEFHRIEAIVQDRFNQNRSVAGNWIISRGPEDKLLFGRDKELLSILLPDAPSSSNLELRHSHFQCLQNLPDAPRRESGSRFVGDDNRFVGKADGNPLDACHAFEIHL